MQLEKLEIAGFKSFAKTTVLSFPSRVTAIVGPNGSGKSNIVEAFRWVLGEQSMKALRGKRGEDLIWNGSASLTSGGSFGTPRMGKAGVTLSFDNADGSMPLDFEKVSMGRKIFRDGLNEYYLNDSQVRLKDVIELTARIGLGETKHNIIGQGEVDRLLLASARDRRAMLEEALGLRVWQLKKSEAERKLEATENNMQQVELVTRELSPHVRFLRDQAKKAEARGAVEQELRAAELAYFTKEYEEISRERARLDTAKNPLVATQHEVRADLARMQKSIDEAEKKFARIRVGNGEEKASRDLELKRRELEREAGRLEAKLELERERARQPKLRSVDMRYIGDEIGKFIANIRVLAREEERADMLRAQLAVFADDLERLLAQIEHGAVEIKKDETDFDLVRELEHTLAGTQEELTRFDQEIEKRRHSVTSEHEALRASQAEMRALDSAARARQEEERDLALELERLKFEEERLRMRIEIYERERKSAGIEEASLRTPEANQFTVMGGEELRRKIERMRAKLEEIGGIDPAVVEEHRELEARHLFLTKELADLHQAARSLKELIRELNTHIKTDFREGFAKIKEEFHNYFRVIFGGGKAVLQLVEKESRLVSGEEGEEGEESEEGGEEAREPGVDIMVDLPRKRIKGLAMLSGGERALTAIALLFAITAVNPPPFLVLDETDAALDEANSQRYSAILKELAKKTQLIIVTHNRETMKSAGILYGVTMGDDGVSKLLSLKLEEAEVYTNR